MRVARGDVTPEQARVRGVPVGQRLRGQHGHNKHVDLNKRTNREINSSLRAVWYILARQNGPRAKGPRAVLAGENIPHARKDEFIGILVTLARVAR